MTKFQNMTQEERQALRVERMLGGKPEKRTHVVPARQYGLKMRELTDEPAAYDNGFADRLLAKAMAGTAQRPEPQWQKELTPEALEEMLKVTERQRKADEELAARAFEAFTDAISYLSAATGVIPEPTEHKIRRLMERVAEVAAKGGKLVYLHRTGGHCVICGKKLKVSGVCRECMEAWVGP